jgi:hypothetical protein
MNLVGRESQYMSRLVSEVLLQPWIQNGVSLPTYIDVFLVIRILHEGKISITSGH